MYIYESLFRSEARKFVTRYFHSELGAETRLFATNTAEELKTLLRAVVAATPKELSWRAGRGYLLAQEAEPPGEFFKGEML